MKVRGVSLRFAGVRALADVRDREIGFGLVRFLPAFAAAGIDVGGLPYYRLKRRPNALKAAEWEESKNWTACGQ